MGADVPGGQALTEIVQWLGRQARVHASASVVPPAPGTEVRADLRMRPRSRANPEAAPDGGNWDAGLRKLLMPVRRQGATSLAGAGTAGLMRRRIWRTGEAGAADEKLIIATLLPSRLPSGSAVTSTFAQARVLLVVLTPRLQAEVDPVLMAASFGLTRAETTVAQALGRGEDPQRIADARFVSRQTVRSQMRTIYRKLGVRRQVDLVRIISKMPHIDLGAAADPASQTTQKGSST